MRLARNLLLAAATAIAAMALMAGSAYAQSVEVVDEADSEHCGEVTTGVHTVSGGCEVTAVSTTNAVTFQHTGTSEAVTSSCENEFAANINEDGTGYIAVDETSIHTNPGAGCVLQECDEAEPSHATLEWPISGMFEYGGGQEEMVVTFCIRPFNTLEGEGNTPCTVLIDVAQIGHAQQFTADQEPCHENPARELSGQWATDGLEDEIEINHIHYPTD